MARKNSLFARYFVAISDPSELAGAMTDKLVELFEEEPKVVPMRTGRPAKRLH